MAIYTAKKPAIPLPVSYGEEYYIKIWKRAEPSCIITDFGGDLHEIPIFPETYPEPPQEDTAVILFTSGSTGTPKGVMLSEENLISNIKDIGSYFPISKHDTILIARPLYHSSVLTGEFLLSLCKGAKIVFSSEPFQPLNILTLMKKHHVTVYGSTPTLLATLSRFVRNHDDLTIRLLSVSGECMTEGMAKAIRKGFPNADVYCGYGLSEASPRVAYLPAYLFDDFPTATGIPVPSVELRLLDKEGNIIQGAMEIGEVLVQGPNVMQGYFDDADRTECVLKDGWLYTGDLAYWDHSGMLCVQGRKDDMIIRAGMNVYPVEIENTLSTDPRVKDVLVYGYKKGDTQEIGMKICGEFSNMEEVLELCRKELPSFQIPSKIELVDETEVLSGGKKKRKCNVNAEQPKEDNQYTLFEKVELARERKEIQRRLSWFNRNKN